VRQLTLWGNRSNRNLRSKSKKPSVYPGPALSSHRQRLTSYYTNSYCCYGWWDCEGASVFVAINK
jgi:hypothetical protein